jgi:thiamine-phosphate pyrophosphorylase
VTAALPAPPLLFITDRLSATVDLRDVVAAALRAGCRWIMVREKDLDTAALGALAADIVVLARPYGACVLVNGDIEAAVAAGARGVHLQAAEGIGRARAALGADALVGVSAHTVTEARDAAAAGADYVTISPVFLTDSKPRYGPALGVEGLAAACFAAVVPVIALAGISPANAAQCFAAGAGGIAVMGGIMRAADPEAAVRAVLDVIP